MSMRGERNLKVWVSEGGNRIHMMGKQKGTSGERDGTSQRGTEDRGDDWRNGSRKTTFV